jgi:hypothetical protein
MNFDRISSTIDVNIMQQSHVTMIGGAYGLCKDLVRCGLGSLTIVDFDSIAATNPARQDFYTSDLGKYKVEAVAAELKKINPSVEIEYHIRDYCEISQQEHDTLFGHTDLFIFGTDYFPAQARGNFEATRINKPAIWIGLYQGGRAGEIIYHVPGVTEACYRCICSSRYRAFYSNPTSVTVSSDGGTIFDLHFVDAIAGPLAAGIITLGADNRIGRLIEKLGNRNLLQMKLDPDYTLGSKDIFRNYLGNHPANFSFTTITLPMERDPNCPDCSAQHNQPSENVQS